MSGENEREWGVLGATVCGASHIQANKPNQDAILWKQGDQAGLPLMLAISDGHGSEKYFRSHIGADFAVKIAVDEMDSMVRQVPFPVTNFTLVKQLFTEELPKGIVARWQKEMKQHWEDHPLTKEEWEVLRKKENASALATILSNPTIPYGATLLAVLVTPSFILYLQLGDGDIIMVSESGRAIKIMQADKRLVANETTSLCSTTPATIKDDVRKQFHILEGAPPALIMLSTDGYSNSFTKEEGFLKAGFDIFKKLREDGVDTVNRSLPEWLTKTSEGGSGDDISLGLLFRMSALKKPAVFSLAQFTNLAADAEAPVDVAQRKESQGAPARSGEPIAASPGQNVAGEVSQGAGQAAAHATSLPGPASMSDKQSKEPSSPIVAGNDLPGQPVNVHDGKTMVAKPSASPVQDVQRDEKKVAPTSDQPPIKNTIFTLVVSQKPGEGNYTSVGEALRHVRSQTRIEVRPGTYRERDTLVLTQDIELVATGPQDSVILGAVPCLQIRSERAVIQGFSIQGRPGVSGLLAREKAVVDILAGQAQLISCDITSQSDLCVRVRGSMTAPTLAGCAIHHSAGKGILFEDKAQGRLVDSQIFENRLVGIEVLDGSNPTIHRCQIHNGRERGIVFADKAQGRLVDSQIFENGLVGIEIVNGGNPTIHHCQIHNGREKGLFIWKGGAGRIEQCSISTNQSTGIEIRREGNPIIQGCQIFENRGSGIVVDESGQGTVVDCAISENAGHGIEIYRSSTPTIKDCKLRGGKKRGIVVEEQGAGIIDNCDIEAHAKSGVFIGQKANPVIKNCRIHHGQSDGVRVSSQGRGKLENCDIVENALHEVEVRESSITIAGGSIRHQAEEANHTIVVLASRLVVEHCKIEAPTNVGILAQDQSHVTVRACYTRCGSFCLAVSRESTAEVVESNLQSSQVSKPWAVEQGSHLYLNGERYRP